MSAFQERSAGFRDGLARANLPVDRAAMVEAVPTKAGGAAALAAMMDRLDPPTGIVCFNDIVAVGAILALARRGLRAGADIAVVGFDDIAEAAHMAPALTSVAVDPIRLGKQAARMLLRRTAGATLRPEVYVGEAQLVVREFLRRAAAPPARGLLRMTGWGLVGASAVGRDWMIPALRETGGEILSVMSSDPPPGARLRGRERHPRSHGLPRRAPGSTGPRRGVHQHHQRTAHPHTLAAARPASTCCAKNRWRCP